MTEEEHVPTAERLRELLVGRKVVNAVIKSEAPRDWYDGPTGYLTLDDGRVLKVWGNTGGCACSAGDYTLEELNDVDNVITNVDVEYEPDTDYAQVRGYYRVFVYAENKRVNLMSFEGSDGNGYYGTGYYIEVSE